MLLKYIYWWFKFKYVYYSEGGCRNKFEGANSFACASQWDSAQQLAKKPAVS